MTDQTDSAASSTMLAYQPISSDLGAPWITPASGNSGLTVAMAQSRKGNAKKASDAPCTNLTQRFSCSR